MFRRLFSGVREAISDAIENAKDTIQDVLSSIIPGRANTQDEVEPAQDTISETRDELVNRQEQIEDGGFLGSAADDASDDLQQAIADLDEASAELEAAIAQTDQSESDIPLLIDQAIEDGVNADEFRESLEELALDDESIDQAVEELDQRQSDLNTTTDDLPGETLVDLDQETGEAYDAGLSDDEFYAHLIEIGLSESVAYDGLNAYLDFQVERYNERRDQAVEYGEYAAETAIPLYTLTDDLKGWGYTDDQINAGIDAYFVKGSELGTLPDDDPEGSSDPDELGNDYEYRKTVTSLNDAQQWVTKVPSGKFVRRVDEDGQVWYDLYAAACSDPPC